jgi:hypothetical protein
MIVNGSDPRFKIDIMSRGDKEFLPFQSVRNIKQI